jgi:hypothetical protein
LVAWETLLVEADRLQSFLRQPNELEQRAYVQSRVHLVVQVGGRRLGHPDRDVEALAVRRHQVVGRRRSAASLADPEGLTREWVERIEDPRALIIRILSTVGTTT